MKTKSALVIVALFLMVSPLLTPILSNAAEVRDGSWWLSQDKGGKVIFMQGVMDGMNLGRSFSIWDLDVPERIENNKLVKKILEAYERNFS